MLPLCKEIGHRRKKISFLKRLYYDRHSKRLRGEKNLNFEKTVTAYITKDESDLVIKK